MQPSLLGLNTRGEWMPKLLSAPSFLDDLPISFLEVIADNFLEASASSTHLNAVAQRAPVHLHCVGMNLGGYDPLDMDYIAKIKELSKQVNARVLSDHLCIQVHEGVHVHDLLPFAWNQDSLARISERVDQVQQTLGRQIAVENLSQYIYFADSTWSEAEFLHKLCEKTGCGLLVDVNNLVVNEKNYAIDPIAELDIMAECTILESHLAGSEKVDSLWIDTHGSDVEPRTFELFAYLQSKKSEPIPVVYERDTNVPPLEEVMEHCRNIQAQLERTADG